LTKIPQILHKAACYIHLTFTTLGYKPGPCLITFIFSATQTNVLNHEGDNSWFGKIAWPPFLLA